MATNISVMVKKARKLARDFKDITDEQKESQTFWNRFFDVFGQDRLQIGIFEKRITKSDGDDGRIDVFWPSELIVEHKSKGKSLDKAKNQATAYLSGIDEHEYPKRLIVSDFDKIRVYSYENWEKYEEIRLSELYNNLDIFGFMSGHVPRDFSKNVEPVTINAAKAVAKFVDEIDKSGSYTDLGLFLTRLIFLMYSEDATIMRKGAIRQLLNTKTKKDGSNLGETLDKIFRVVNQDYSERSNNLDVDYSNLPYINGPLFSKKIDVIDFDEKIRISLIKLFNLDWREVSPSLFGSLFQQVMDENDRKILGSHYTSDENIRKVIDDLFLSELKSEYEAIKGESTHSKKILELFQEKLGKIKLLDPACGCGNFLVVAYQELRLLEFEVLKRLASFSKDSTGKNTRQLKLLDVTQSIHVKPSSLYGIEIDEFAAYVCQLSILIADAQLNNKMSNYFVDEPIENIPIKEIANIHTGNALDVDWEIIIDKEDLTHIIGNPPFLGYSRQTQSQKEDMVRTFGKKTGSLDYVAAWYIKAAEFIQGTRIKIGYVSTNSICQGEQVALLWENLILNYGIHINFAHQPFEWSNSAPKKAAVHVVINGFWAEDVKKKQLHRYPNIKGKPETKVVKHINPYLGVFKSEFLPRRKEPLCNVTKMIYGSKATDGGHLFLSRDEREELIKSDPALEKYVKRFMGSVECINNIERYCLWLKDYVPNEIKGSEFIQARLKKVRTFRENSKKKPTQLLAETPYLFGEERQPSRDYLLVPRHSSETRTYIPTGYFSSNVIVGDSAFCVPSADEYTFGVFNSVMHMTWMKYVCGRIKSDFRYSNTIVYNNFPWPEKPSDSKMKSVKDAAKEVLEIRTELQKKSSLADIYASNITPKNLLDAHKKLDKAVDKCYRTKAFKNDEDRMEFLFNLYSKLDEIKRNNVQSVPDKLAITNQKGPL